MKVEGYLKEALVITGVIVAVTVINTMFPIPVIGSYLPKKSA